MSEQRNEKLDLSQEPIDEDTLCGVGSCTPPGVQCCANVALFTASAGFVSLFLQTLSTYISSQLTSLEKQFGLSSTDSGILVSCNDIGFLSCVLIASHFGRKGHIPRILAVSALIYGISGVICSLSQFIEPASLPDGNSLGNDSLSSDDSYLCSSDNGVGGNSTCSEESTKQSGDQWIVVMIALALVLQGICKSPRTSLSTVYIDNNVSDKKKTSLYLGTITTLTLFGPALAFTLGGAFSRIPVDLKDTELTPTDPRWIGAWWLGFLIFGAISIVVAFPLFFFPKKLPSSWMPPEKEDTGISFLEKVKGLPVSVLRVIKSPIYTLTLIAITFINFYVGGYVSFGPKYLENQFMIPAWQANIIQGIQAAISIGCGTFLGGYVTSRFRLNPRGCLRFVVCVCTLAVLLQSLNFVFGCEHPGIVGLESEGPGTATSTGCDCSEAGFLPVCGVDTGSTYRSPCHAGCQIQNDTIYGDCIREGGGEVSMGMCDTGCPFLYPFVINSIVMGLIGTLSIIPAYIIMLRSVEEEDKSMAIGILSFTISVLGFLPAPIVFGRVIDSTCKMWNYKCGVQGSCAVYDIVDLRMKIVGMNVGLNAAAAFSFLIAFLVRKYVVKYDKQDVSGSSAVSDTKL